MKKLRNYLISGVLILLPVMITFSLIFWMFEYVDNLFLAQIIYAAFGIDNIPGLGLIMTVMIILLVGALATNIIGKKIINYGEYLLNKIPLVNSVYKTLKQIVDAFSNREKNAFQRPVLVEYPRKGIWAIAFVTGETEGEVQHKTDDQVINVFLPTTPNPTSGFLLMIPRRDTIALEMTVEEAVKMIISAGVVTPSYKGGDKIEC
ncbi:MAG: DUF502 domain-containing protein [Bacillota bacterium]|nr:DUF502 domain-containing protein [Bacillota bacterium]